MHPWLYRRFSCFLALIAKLAVSGAVLVADKSALLAVSRQGPSALRADKSVPLSN